MIYGAREIEADLKALRRGWGIEAPDIESRIGAALRAAFRNPRRTGAGPDPEAGG